MKSNGSTENKAPEEALPQPEKKKKKKKIIKKIKKVKKPKSTEINVNASNNRQELRYNLRSFIARTGKGFYFTL